MGVTWQGKIVLVGVLVFASYLAWGSFADGREAQRLADLGPCGVAHAYVGWRVEFDDALGGATSIEGADFDAFTRRSGAFERAAGLVDAGSTPSAQATVIGRLRSLTRQDADRSNTTLASTDAFMDAFVDACPAQFVELMARFAD